MVGWNDAGSSSSNNKKCHFEMCPLHSKFPKYRAAVADEMIDEV